MILRNAVAGVAFLVIMLSFYAPSKAGTAEEIATLLHFVEQSDCTFIRNGRQYDSVASRQHIEKKYNYFKDKVLTTEDFIRYSATGSSITGKPYEVICNGVTMNSSDWLNIELEKMRKK